MASRQEVYEAIDSERDYQERRWTPETTTSGGQHSIEAWVVYLQDYLTECIHQLSRNGRPMANDLALDTIRKLAAMCVACMEQHGAPKRDG